MLGGRYELRDLIGTGGSGAVHLAHDRTLGRDVAVKLLRPGQDGLAHARLRTEARLAAALTHPGIARLLDLGEDERPPAEGGATTPYLVMEYVAGSTLRQVLRTGDRLTVEKALNVLAQVADALAAVHDAGIVHRDLKPGNIMLAEDGRAVLLDFGIARHHDGEPLTLTGTIVGTVDYISPEQASGASAMAASDIYALGMVIYECLTGLRPLNRDTQVSTLMAHATTPVPSLPPTFAPGLRDLVAAMVNLDPTARPGATAVAERARELLRAGAARRVLAVLPMDATGRAASREMRRTVRRWHGIVALCAVALAVVAGLVMATRGGASVAPPVAGAATSSAMPRTRDPGTTSPVVAVRAATPAPKGHPAPALPRHRSARRVAPHRTVHAADHGHGKKKGWGSHRDRHPGRPAHAGHGKG